jgi:hypothetical protein
MRTQVNDVSMHASGAAAFLIEIDAVSKIGPTLAELGADLHPMTGFVSC